jgi:DNA-binding MarR family transcriptional regulator
MSERVLVVHPAGATAETAAARVAARASHMMGCDVGREWVGEEAMAWEGLLEVSRRLRRAAEEVLLEGFDLTISMLGITGRLSLAPECTLRQTALAEAMGLSLSRVSRVIDLLEARALVERSTCPSDARATNVTLTRQGAKLTRRAQQALFGEVKASFFDHLEEDEVRTLARVFARLVDLPGAEVS